MKDIREAAAARLASGERTGKELLDFLVKKGYDRSEAREVVEEFRELGYIDEERYASLFVSYAAGKGWGSGR
ncbi:MAG: RecX family transcriptional regulator, partial [Firmicutes bacterium]|nr:RecX family transcriptional regulator [Bacillota bacterium]